MKIDNVCIIFVLNIKIWGDIYMKQKHHSHAALTLNKIPSAALAGTVKALEMPADLLLGMAHFELSGNREVIIDGCRGILEYDENLIRLNAGKLSVRFTGRGLTIRNLKRDSVIIEGFIASVEFLD